MELYHFHTKRNHDNIWKEGKELIINNNFENRLFKIYNNFNVSAQPKEFPVISSLVKADYMLRGFQCPSKVNYNDLLNKFIMQGQAVASREEVLELLKKVSSSLYYAGIFKREMALENFRKENNSNLPSRLHTLYATDEAGIEYWKRILVDGNMDLYLIDVIDEPFKTSEQLIPEETLSYGDFYKAAYKYWNPKNKDLNGVDCEYLVNGKVKILKKVDEIRRR